MTNTIIVKNTRDSTVATISPGTFDLTTPLTLPGRGASGWALQYNQNDYHLLENFAKSTAPSAPVEGMFWYDTGAGMKYRTSASWVPLATGSNSDIILSRMVTADDINMNAIATHNLHTGAAGVKTLITGLMLVPNSGASVAGVPPAVSLEVSTGTGDVADKIVLSGLTSSSKFFKYNIAGSQRIVNATEVVKLSVKSAISGGDTLVCDAYLYGITL